MYSLILMTAMAAGPDTAGFGGRHASCYGCCGGYVAASCYGCCGGSYASCCGGGCCGGGYVSSCYGCCGGSRSGGLFHHHKSYSCCGGYAACYGGCCGGGSSYPSGYGSAAYGACYGAFYYGSCYGYGTPAGCFGSCYGGAGGIVYPSLPAVTAPAAGGITYPVLPTTTPSTPPADGPKTALPMDAPPGLGYNPAGADEAPARLTIAVPANATLIVDGQPTRGAGAVRQFHTPPLAKGRAFFYELRAEVEIDGKVEVEEKRVVVKAGDALSEAFPKLIAAAAGKGDALAAK